MADICYNSMKITVRKQVIFFKVRTENIPVLINTLFAKDVLAVYHLCTFLLTILHILHCRNYPRYQNHIPIFCFFIEILSS